MQSLTDLNSARRAMIADQRAVVDAKQRQAAIRSTHGVTR
jgi:hypothetical protein